MKINNINKIINKSKIIFYTAFVFMFSVNSAIATTTTIDIKNGPHFINFREVVVKSFLPWILSVVGILVFFVFIVGVIKYLSCKENKDKQKIIKAKRIVLLSLKSLILIFALYLLVIIFEDSLINILDRIN